MFSQTIAHGGATMDHTHGNSPAKPSH